MKTSSSILGVLFLSLLVGRPAHGQNPEEKPKKPNAFEMADRVLLRSFPFAGFDDPRTTLAEAIDIIQHQHDVNIEVNQQAFQAAGVKDVLNTFIAAPNPLLPHPRTTLKRVLDRILERLPSKSGALVVLRERGIEITTREAVRQELRRGPNEPIPPLVFVRLDKVPLEKALEQLSERTGVNLVLDPRAGDKTKSLVSATFKSVPIDSAVRSWPT